MKKVLNILLVIVLTSCNSKMAKVDLPDKFRIIKATDSTSFIEWTDGETLYKSSKTIENYYVDKKTHVKWSNEKYICLTHSNGSDTWTDIILPFGHNNYIMVENALAYDKINGIVISETDSINFKLVAENLQTEKKEFIGEDWTKCESVFPHYCIDSLNVQSDMLYVEWTIPNKIDKPNKKLVKKIKLKI
jgi:hypothetical protein